MKKTKHDNVFLDGRKLLTLNKDSGKSVYAERLFQENGVEYRNWDARRSKLGAAILKNVELPPLKKKDVWLYLGAASGTTVSHVSDILENGFVFGVEFSPRVLRELYFLAQRRQNIAPILGDASKPSDYLNLVSSVDIVFQDVAQKDQVGIFLKNINYFLKEGGYAILSCKSRSIDVAKRPRDVFRIVERELKDNKLVHLVDWKTLEPFETDHAVFVCQKK